MAVDLGCLGGGDERGLTEEREVEVPPLYTKEKVVWEVPEWGAPCDSSAAPGISKRTFFPSCPNFGRGYVIQGFAIALTTRRPLTLFVGYVPFSSEKLAQVTLPTQISRSCASW